MCTQSSAYRESVCYGLSLQVYGFFKSIRGVLATTVVPTLRRSAHRCGRQGRDQGRAQAADGEGHRGGAAAGRARPCEAERGPRRLEVAAAVEKVKAEMAIAANEAFQRGADFAKELMLNK